MHVVLALVISQETHAMSALPDTQELHVMLVTLAMTLITLALVLRFLLVIQVSG